MPRRVRTSAPRTLATPPTAAEPDTPEVMIVEVPQPMLASGPDWGVALIAGGWLPGSAARAAQRELREQAAEARRTLSLLDGGARLPAGERTPPADEQQKRHSARPVASGA